MQNRIFTKKKLQFGLLILVKSILMDFWPEKVFVGSFRVIHEIQVIITRSHTLTPTRLFCKQIHSLIEAVFTNNFSFFDISWLSTFGG